LTERLLISAEERNPKSTLPMTDGTGCEMFMADNKVLQGTTTAVLVHKMFEYEKTFGGESFEYGNFFGSF
jgi:hypothetical protein